MENIFRSELTSECEVFEYTDEGFRTLHCYGGWRVAVINYAARFDEANFERLERHLETDEVFILIDGRATLIVGKECERIPMELGKIYNIKKLGWHHIIVDRKHPETKLVLVENADTSTENTEYLYVN